MKAVNYLTAAALAVLSTVALSAPAGADNSAVPNQRGAVYAFRCTDNEQLRIIFNAERHRAVVGRIRRPDVTLEQADASAGYRFIRGDAYELTGNLQEVRWRVGTHEPIVCHRGER